MGPYGCIPITRVVRAGNVAAMSHSEPQYAAASDGGGKG
eukprot:COSAG01_NODE_71211_length_256_cov_1.305732_1_plen_38_part_10